MMPKSFAVLSAKLRKRALAQVPPAYHDRDLDYKYLRLDNEAAGLYDAAVELDALIAEWAAYSKHYGNSSAQWVADRILGISEKTVDTVR